MSLLGHRGLLLPPGGSTPPIGCAFPLAGDVTPAGFGQLTMSNVDQTGSVVIGATGIWAAAPAGFLAGTSQKWAASAGLTTLGASMDAMPLAAVGEGVLSMSLNGRSVALSAIVAGIGVSATNGGYAVSTVINNVEVQSVAVGATKPGAVYMVADAANSQVRFAYRVGATVTSLTTQSYTPADLVPTLEANVSAPAGAVVGLPIAATYLTSAADLVSLATGATDNCGTVIPVVSCVYPMDADAIEVMGIGYSARLTLSEGDQKAALTVNNGLGGEKYYAAFTHNTFDVGAAKIDLNGTGKKVIQQILTIPTMATGGSTLLLTMTAHIYGCFQTQVKCYADGEFEARIYGAAQAYVITKGSMAAGAVRLSFEIDTDAGTFGLRINGGALETLSNNAYNVGDAPLFVEIIQANGGFIGGADNGKVIAAQFVTQAADMVGPVTSGYTDACGNLI